MPSLAAKVISPPADDHLTLTESRHGHAHIIAVDGDLNVTNAGRLRAGMDEVRTAAPAQRITIVLDLRRVRVLDAAALAILLDGDDRADDRTDLRIVVARQPVLVSLRTTAAAGRITLYDTPEEALAPERDEVDRLRAELAQRREQLASQPAIEQAKGMLMHNFGLTADEAFALLRRLSQDTNVKVHTVAEQLVATLTGHVSTQGARRVAAVLEKMRTGSALRHTGHQASSRDRESP